MSWVAVLTVARRMQDLGATCFYPCAEADEVDGLEATVDPWVENILGPLQTALQELQQPAQEKQQEPASAAASRPASAVTAAAAAEAAAVAKAEAAVPSANLWPEGGCLAFACIPPQQRADGSTGWLRKLVPRLLSLGVCPSRWVHPSKALLTNCYRP
jgi:hypothetical protein